MANNRPYLIFDGQNAFIRSYSAYPQLSSNGQQMGGCIGFLKTMQRLCREFQPSQVYIAWEGGGSQRRRKIYSEYKKNRKPEKLNRFYEDDIPDSEENRQHQLITLIGMLKHLPVCQIYVPNCEGDDVIAYLSRGPFRNKDKIIVSSDKDMYQLLDENTKIYSLHKKTFVTESDLFEEFRITSENFALAKCLCGDVSDNIPGIKGIGFKSVVKKFPILCNKESIILEDLIKYAASHSSDGVIYKRVVENVDFLKRNWQLVHLDGSMLSADQSNRVNHVLNTFKPSLDKISLIKSMISEGISDFDAEGFFYDLLCIEDLKVSSK